MLKRPILLHTILLILGIVTGYIADSLILRFFSIVILSLIVLIIHRNKIIESRFLLWGGLSFFILGIIQFSYLDIYYDNNLKEFNSKEIEVYGYASSEPVQKEKSQSFNFQLEGIKIDNKTITKEGEILVYISNNGKNKEIDYGQKLIIKGNFEKARPQSNPGGFDYRLYLKGAGISGLMYSNGYDVTVLEGNKGSVIIKLGLYIRNYIVKVVENNFPQEQAGLLSGILIGYTDGLSKPIQQAFSNAGLSHIMAVSGANVVFIILPFAYLFKSSGIRKKHANLFIIGILGIFIAVTGFQPSVLRAVLMADIVLLGQILKKRDRLFFRIIFRRHAASDL